MNWKRILICFGVLYVVNQVLGFLIHQVMLGETYGSLSHVWRPMDDMASKTWIMFLTSAVMTFFFCYIFARGYEGRGIGEGIRYGLIIGLFLGIPQAYDNYVVLPIPHSLALSWFLSGMVVMVVGGVIVSLIYKPADA